MVNPSTQSHEGGNLIIVEDDENYSKRLGRSMEKYGFDVSLAPSVQAASTLMKGQIFTHAIVDLRLEDGSGLDVVNALKTTNPDMAVIILTGYGAIATAVAAVKLGATEYLSKPSVDAEDIFRALMGLTVDVPSISETPMSANRVKWEHIQRVYELCDRNVSETARQLNMHRRTLQRILAKRAPNE